MLTRQEFAAALAGVRGLVRLDVRALGYFDASLQGFWNSFWAAAILAPFTVVLVAHGAMVAAPESMWRFVAFQIIAYAFDWLTFPLAMVWVADVIGRRERYFGFMVAFNWFRLVEIALQAPLLLLAMVGVLPLQAEAFLWLLVLGALLGYQWFIAKNALKVSGGTAAALVAINLLLGLVIDRLSVSLP